MEKNSTYITTYQRKPQIWIGTESAPFPYDLTWEYPLQVCLDRDLLFFRREGEIKVLYNGTDAGMSSRSKISGSLSLRTGWR